jgi:hypothetical protein
MGFELKSTKRSTLLSECSTNGQKAYFELIYDLRLVELGI